MILFASFLFITLISGCGTAEHNTLILISDHPEIAACVEMFNAEQDTYKIELVYDSSPARLAADENIDGDIIFSEGLSSSQAIKQFLSLEELFTADHGIRRDMFYQDSLNAGIYDEKQVILPVSFTLPAILVHSGSEVQQNEGMMISLDTMKETCRTFNAGSTERFPVMGFSPRWTDSFLYLIARIENSGFRESTEGSVVWNNENLEKSIEYSREWITDINGGRSGENYFREKYLYDPGYKLVFSGRILYYPVEYQRFLLIPADIRRDVDFLWLSDGSRIPVNENMIYAGILRRTDNKKAAMAFFSWFFSEKTQEKILESVQVKRIRSFGVIGGFSSIRSVNELLLPKYYPSITGRIPAAGQLAFSPVLPINWNKIRQEVLLPYLREAVVNEFTSASLENRLLTWYTQQTP